MDWSGPSVSVLQFQALLDGMDLGASLWECRYYAGKEPAKCFRSEPLRKKRVEVSR